MKRIGQVRSGRSAHARHANSAGTNPTTPKRDVGGGCAEGGSWDSWSPSKRRLPVT